MLHKTNMASVLNLELCYFICTAKEMISTCKKKKYQPHSCQQCPWTLKMATTLKPNSMWFNSGNTASSILQIYNNTCWIKGNKWPCISNSYIVFVIIGLPLGYVTTRAIIAISFGNTTGRNILSFNNKYSNLSWSV